MNKNCTTRLRLTSLLRKILSNVNVNVSLTFYLEDDTYCIELTNSSRLEFEELCMSSTDVCDEYKGAKIVEFWSANGGSTDFYIDERNDHYFKLSVRRNGELIRFYSRERLFFGK